MPTAKRPPGALTHFLCIPIVTPNSRPQLQKSLDTFRTDAGNRPWPRYRKGVPDGSVRPLGTLHFTLGIMSLTTREHVDAALALLHSLDISSLLSPSSHKIAAAMEKSGKQTNTSQNQIQEPSPLEITLVGLNSMHDPARTSILYAAPSLPSRQLYTFCNRLRGAFADFLVQQDRQLLLHATILNTGYASGVRDQDRRKMGRLKAKTMVDARELLQKYWDYVWMKDMRLERLAICRMGAKKVKDAEGRETEDEEYIVEGEMGLPWT